MIGRRMGALLIALTALLVLVPEASAHVPYIERKDFTAEDQFEIADVEQSIAVYAWIEQAADVDFYAFVVDEPIQLFAELLVPVCPAYADFLPSLALLGPGLPAPQFELPVDLLEGHGAIVVPNVEPGGNREQFYEPFGGKHYYEGPVLSENLQGIGTYMLITWDPYGLAGDYVAAVGTEERFNPRDIVRALVNTRLIRGDRELHTDC